MSKETFGIEQKVRETKAFIIDNLPKEELAEILQSIAQTETAKKRVSDLGKRSRNPSEATLNVRCI